MATKKPGLYANIHAKQQRIARGSGETMRKPGAKGAPKAENFAQAEKTEKPAVKKSAGTKRTSAKPAARSTAATKAPAKKPAAKKTAAKKTAAKKTATKKTVAKKSSSK